MLYFFYRLARRGSMLLPLGVIYKIALAVADVYYFFAREDKRNLEYNLKIVLGKNDKKLIRRYTREIFRNFAKYLVDFFRFSKLSKRYILNRVSVEGKENLAKALAGGRGAILLAAHIGNWEMGAAITANLGYPFYAIALDHKDSRVNNFFLQQRAFANVRIIPVGTQLKKCFRMLKENSLLAIVGDRDFSGHGAEENFFGRPAILPKGPAFFSLRTGAPIIPTFCLRLKDDSFRMIFSEPIAVEAGDSRDDAQVKKIMRRYIPAMERCIREFPDQWYAFRKMWE